MVAPRLTPQAAPNSRRPTRRLWNRAKYQYDGLQRLTAAEWKDSGDVSLYAYEYDYDRVGNRTHLLYNGTHTYYTYNEANELLSEQTLGGDTAYYSYDGRGNEVQREVVGGDTTYFSYNSRDLITRIDSTESGFTTNTFEYNAQGQRVKKVDSTGTTRYVWDGLNILLETDSGGTITRRYTLGSSPIEAVAQLIDVEDVSSGNHYFYHFDQVGGVHRLTAENQTTAQSLEFSPYGRMLVETGSAPNPFAFPATYLRLADVVGSVLSGTRAYEVTTGRYQGRDLDRRRPVYRALADSPLSAVDPSGRKEYGDYIDPETGERMPFCGDCHPTDPVHLAALHMQLHLKFMTWYRTERDDLKKTEWTKALPPCPCRIFEWKTVPECVAAHPHRATATTYRRERVFTYDRKIWRLEPDWRRSLVRFFRDDYHPGATYELRTKSPTAYGKAGQQCTYDSEGNLITEGVGAGTVDKISPSVGLWGGHTGADVSPADWAWALDRALGYKKGEGPYFQKYLEVRPIAPREKCKHAH